MPVQKNKMVQKAYLLIIQTGDYKEACIKWNHKAMGNQLWPILKEHLYKVHNENRQIKQATDQVSGFANAAVYEEKNGYHRETTTEIQTLVEATYMDRINVANPAEDNTKITRNITTITTEMETIQNLMGKSNHKSTNWRWTDHREVYTQ